MAIRSVEIVAGRDFRRRLDPGGGRHGRFNDRSFQAPAIPVFGPGRTLVRVLAENSVGRSTATPWRSSFAFPTTGPGFDPPVPGNRKWSIAVEVDDKNGTAILETGEVHTVPLRERSQKLLVPKERPRNYFVLHKDYTADLLTWDRDGMTRGQPGDPASLICLDPCCAHSVPIVGVEMRPPGSHRIQAGEGIDLQAVPKPRKIGNVSGELEWLCLDHPPGATFRFDPSGPTTSDKARFFTDTPGIYTFQVRYGFPGVSSDWTYAVGDGRIIFETDPVCEIYRLGPYAGELAEHRDRPYYEERSLTLVRGAEVRVRGRNGAPLGQDFLLKVQCAPELALDSSLSTRLLFSDGTQRDLKVPVYRDNPFQGSWRSAPQRWWTG